MDRSASRLLSHRSRRRLVVLALVALILGQATALVLRTSKLWPFTEVRPYAWFPADHRGTSLHFVVSDGEERWDLPALPGVNHRILRRYEAAYRSAARGTGPQRGLDSRQVLGALLDYARRHARHGSRLEALEVLRLDWSLDQGTARETLIEIHRREG